LRIARGSFLIVLIAGSVLFEVSGHAATPVPTADPVAVEIERHLADAVDSLKVDGELLDAVALKNFYQPRGWRAAWSDGADKVRALLAVADQEGLPLFPFHLNAIAARLNQATPQKRAEGDMMLTDAVLRYAAAMRGQRVDPAEIEDDWFVPTPPFDAVAFVAAHLRDADTALAGLAPPFAAYQALRGKLAWLRAVAAAGDWPKVAPGTPIKPDMDDERVGQVRLRLKATGEFTDADTTSAHYDAALVEAVKLFQRRHGLEEDGVVGGRTLAALNVSAADRARQVAVNMERWRWLPQHLERDHIVVNVPAQWMEVVEGGNAVLSMRVVVGDEDHPTPALHAILNSVVLNPVWRVPASIATEEILPHLKKNPGYLVANDLELVSDSFAPGSPESQGVGIPWHEMTTMPWPVRQRPGSDNALGRIKFNIPNSDDIYLHDTPNRKAFAKNARALSHGCVRLEKPDDLALYLLKGWTQDKLDQEIGKGETHTYPAGKSIPVWLLYWTSWVDADGILQFRDDIYGRDLRLAAALARANRAPTLMASSGTAVAVQSIHCEGCRVP
jgi:murein L,D-transpeptidase YcbB/YkuD